MLIPIDKQHILKRNDDAVFSERSGILDKASC